MLLWWPFRFGQPEWEFGIITGFLDGLPVATVGLALLTVGAIARRWRFLTRLGVLIALFVVVALLGMSVIYLLDVPLALKSSPPETRTILYRSMLKSGVFALAYTVFYAWLAQFAWRLRT